MKPRKDSLFIIIAIICGILFGILYFWETQREKAAVASDSFVTVFDVSDEASTPAPESILIHIDGAVENPGVYALSPDGRVNDAVLKAGGLKASADTSEINLAAFLQDGQKITIPEKRMTDNTAQQEAEKTAQKVNINTAGPAELKTLPGIGEVTAGNIISYREKHGRFKAIAEIQNVPRIGERTFEQIEGLITTGD